MGSIGGGSGGGGDSVRVGRWTGVRRSGADGSEEVKVAEVPGSIPGGRTGAPVVKWYDISLPLYTSIDVFTLYYNVKALI